MKCSGKQANKNGSCAGCARLDLACSFASAEAPSDQGQGKYIHSFYVSSSLSLSYDLYTYVYMCIYTYTHGNLHLTYECRLGKVSRIAPSKDRTEAGTVRKRAQRACRECHAHKTKCSGDLPLCKRCEDNDLPCEYTPSKRKFAHAPGSVASPGDDPVYDDLGEGLPLGEDEASHPVLSPTTFSGSSAVFTPQARRRSSIVEQLYGEYGTIPDFIQNPSRLCTDK